MIKTKALISNCKTGEVIETDIDFDNDGRIEQELLESLKPSEKEIKKAETELLIVEILQESGLI